MQTIDEKVKLAHKNRLTNVKRNKKQAVELPCIDSVVSLLNNIVEIACERGPDLDLLRLTNLMDLYRIYLELANDPTSDLNAYVVSISGPLDAVVTQKLGKTELISFERFVRDSHLLDIAAIAASREAGENVATPPPLTVSAND